MQKLPTANILLQWREEQRTPNFLCHAILRHSAQKIILNKNPFETSAGSQSILKNGENVRSSEDFLSYSRYKPNGLEKAKLL